MAVPVALFLRPLSDTIFAFFMLSTMMHKFMIRNRQFSESNILGQQVKLETSKIVHKKSLRDRAIDYSGTLTQ